MGLKKSDLDTPCLILDLDFLDQNLVSMQQNAVSAGKNLRPHTKTHKSSEVAKKQLEIGAVGVCAAKVSEAEALVNAGVTSVLITGPVSTEQKIRRMVSLLQDAPALMCIVDNPDGIRLLAGILRENNKQMGVLLDLDAGLHRTGVNPRDALDIANLIREYPELTLRGIQAYAGQVQHISSFEERKTESLSVLEEPARVFRELQAGFRSCDIFSASGTGTFDIDILLPELTDLQTGSYAVMDSEYLAIGSKNDPARNETFNPALRLLTSVVSSNQNEFVTVDAGLKSLYKDGGVPRVYGKGAAWLTYNWFGDEYGRIIADQKSGLPGWGTQLELIVSHCDPTINLFNQYHLVRGEEVVGTWPIDLRGCSQ